MKEEKEEYVSTCDRCKYMDGECASMAYPYPVTFCQKGHWEGGAPPSAKEEDCWRDCKDFTDANG